MIRDTLGTFSFIFKGIVCNISTVSHSLGTFSFIFKGIVCNISTVSHSLGTFSFRFKGIVCNISTVSHSLVRLGLTKFIDNGSTSIFVNHLGNPALPGDRNNFSNQA